MFNTPILLIVFNRLDTTIKVFNKIKEIQPEKLFIAADGPRENRPNEKEKCNEVREWVLNNITWNCELNTLFRNNNIGCRDGVYTAIKWFFEKVDYGIILEDDCLPDLSFFPYCEELLIKYKNISNIGLISGRNNCNKSFSKHNESYQFTTGGGIWGWATWKRVFDNFNPTSLTLFYADDLYKRILSFTKDKEETLFVLNMLKKELQEYNKTWDYQWGVYLKYNNLLSITPSKNLIHNIGFEGESTHYTDTNITDIDSYSISFPLIHPNSIKPNIKLSKEIASFCFERHSSLLDRLIKRLKNNLKSIVRKA